MQNEIMFFLYKKGNKKIQTGGRPKESNKTACRGFQTRTDSRARTNRCQQPTKKLCWLGGQKKIEEANKPESLRDFRPVASTFTSLEQKYLTTKGSPNQSFAK